MKARQYSLIEHTADIGIRVKGKTLKELFSNAGLAMFDLIAERKTERAGRKKKIKIKQEADGLDELFINWLNELLSLSATKELIFSEFKINSINENKLQAVATGEGIKAYRVNAEIKAATYHELEIKRSPSGWQAKVIFDV